MIVKYGATESPLAATRSREVRVFKRLETLVAYLKELGINRLQVAQSVKEADEPATQWVSNETAMVESAKRRAA